MSWWTEQVLWTLGLLAVLTLAAPLSRRFRRAAARRHHPDGIEAYVRVVDGRVPYVPAAGMHGVLVATDRSFSFLDTRVRGLVPVARAGPERAVRGREAWKLGSSAVVIPLRLLGGAVVEVAVLAADADRVRALVESPEGDGHAP